MMPPNKTKNAASRSHNIGSGRGVQHGGDMQQWLVDEISHQVGDGGYVCGVRLERIENMNDGDIPAP